MRLGRALGTLTAAAAASCVIAACGGSGPDPGSADPANKVPSTALLYGSVTVRPDTSLRNDLVQTIDKLGGPGAAQKLGDDLVNSLHNSSEFDAFKKFAGTRIGIALTALPAGNLTSQAAENDLLVVLPVTDPSAARKYITAHPPTTAGLTARVEGDYLISGGATAMSAVPVSPHASLAASSAYRSAISQLGSGRLATVFIQAHPLLARLLPQIEASAGQSPQASSEASTLLSEVPAGATVALGFSAGTNTFTFDALTHGFKAAAGSGTSSQAPDIGSLPSSSWLALALDITPQEISSLQAELPGLLTQAQNQAGAIGGAGQAQGLLNGSSQFLRLVERDVIPALGPATLSLGSSSIGGFQAGLVLTPHDAAAGDRLLNVLHGLLKHDQVLTSKVGNQLVLTLGYPYVQALLSPGSRLAFDPTYKQALAHLPAGSKVPFYLNIGRLAEFGSAVDTSPGDASVWQVAKKLNYLIVGGTHGHLRIVLAVK
ncbi:MAG: DUF3352 domain-containing protein [Conexibacteraceae bacterium]|nr:DUF3352 domain-containing protein [Conexibacteraceae bacterium]